MGCMVVNGGCAIIRNKPLIASELGGLRRPPEWVEI